MGGGGLGGDGGGGYIYKTTIPARSSLFNCFKKNFWLGLCLRTSIEFQIFANDISGILLKVLSSEMDPAEIRLIR